MKIGWFYIRMFCLLLVTLFLVAFSHRRNSDRTIKAVEVNFEAGANLFITAETVDKLLIQNGKPLEGQRKEILVLKNLEDKLDAHAMISDADVYLTLDGVVGATVKQRKPLGRVQAQKPFYIDENGSYMPLSTNYSARVPLIDGVSREQIKEVYPLLNYLQQDDLLAKQVIGISRNADGNYSLTPRVLNYNITLGKIKDLQSKFANYKAFYQKAIKDNSLPNYKNIDLRFKGQVVGTKI
jgi:cell division protein FtsQ